ncbi:MAG: Fe(3+)-binding periplasmic protein [Candidatus Dichloromethanomonas elyunquensis]|nr:MAG: Fe(3+)-binding periplasmic protein [Candidatus Dichloromethanomonas elyunquensis]
MRFLRTALVGLIFVALAIMGTGCGNGNTEKMVVVYTSVDQEFAEPILKKFESSTGIKVMPVYDVEAAKTTGLVNRLISEKSKPQADVFWNSEFMQTLLLKEQGVLAAYQSPAAADLPQEYRDKDHQWIAFGGRVHVLIYNTNLVPADQVPKSIYDLTGNKYGGSKAAIAYPMFGTSATHAAAMYALLGPDKAKAYFTDLKAGKVQIVDGNSVVRDLVAQGQLAMGLTDSDDALGAIEKGSPVKVVIPDQDGIGALVTPNTVALISGAPHADTAKKLMDYLASKEVEEELMKIGFSQVSTRSLSTSISLFPQGQIQRMKVDFPSVYSQQENVKKDLTEIFVR